MKYLIITLFGIILMGCGEANTEETTKAYILPEGLSDCKIYRLEPQNGVILRVVRCPNSETSTSSRYQSGKYIAEEYNVVIEE